MKITNINRTIKFSNFSNSNNKPQTTTRHKVIAGIVIGVGIAAIPAISLIRSGRIKQLPQGNKFWNATKAYFKEASKLLDLI